MDNEEQPEWQEIKPLEISRAVDKPGNLGNRKPGPRPQRAKKLVHELAEKLQLDNRLTLWRIDLARMMWGNGSVKSTILQGLINGNPAPKPGEPLVPKITPQQAYIYYHRMMQELQGDHTLKSHAQKTAEARARLESLGKAAQKAGEFDVARRIFADLALIDRTPNPTTAARTVALFEGGDAPAQAVPHLTQLNREQLMALAVTGKLPAPRG